MKNLTLLASAAILAAGCQNPANVATESSAPATPVAFNASGAPTVIFSVPDMMCPASCVEAVKEALSSQPGVKEVQVDFETKRATVAIDADKFEADAAIATLVDYQFTNSQLVTDSAQHVLSAKPQVDGDAPTEN